MVCPVCGEPEATGTLDDAAFNELSGVVASLEHPGVFWVHNDSGAIACFYAIDITGKRLATISVSGVDGTDWEDIARGPCPAGTCLFLADFGDNGEERSSYVIYRVPEPSSIADAAVAAEALEFTYPDGSHDAEALLVHPSTGAITIVTKVFVNEAYVYEFPLPLTPGVPVVLEGAGSLPASKGGVLVTGGDVHPSGKGLLLRSYWGVRYFPIAAGEGVAAALAGESCVLPLATEPQGEAVGWLADGGGYVTLSEGVGTAVSRVLCSGPW